MKHKEQWIESVINSMQQHEPPAAPKGIEDRILQRVATGEKAERQLLPIMAWQLAAGLLLLIGANLFSMLYFNEYKMEQGPVKNPVVSEYFSYVQSF